MSTPPIPGWQSAASDAHFSAPSQCAKRADRFERTIRIRNVIEYGAGALCLVLFGGVAAGAFYKGELLIGFASIAIVAGFVMVMRNLRRRASNLDRRPEDACLAHLRRQYQRQYDALRTIWSWYLGPLVPGLMLFYAAFAIGAADIIGWARAIEGIVFPVAATTALFGVIATANMVAARSIKRKIDALDGLA